MKHLDNIPFNTEVLYEEGYNYNGFKQRLYFQKTFMKANKKNQYFIKSYIINNKSLICQGYIYFYLEDNTRTSNFIGVYVKPEYRNSGLASFLTAHWIQFCLNNGYNFLGTNKNQRKPFLLYLLKTYGFEIFDTSFYDTSKNIINICKKDDDNTKYLLFKNSLQAKAFLNSRIAKEDNYQVITDLNEKIYYLDKVILSTPYNMNDISKAEQKCAVAIKKYHN